MQWKMNQQKSEMKSNQSGTDSDDATQYGYHEPKLVSSVNDFVLTDLMSNDRHVPKVGSLIYNRVFVKGLPNGTSLCDIHRTFSQYGKVIETKLIVDRAGHSKGYGFITFTSTDDALNVLREKESVFVNGKQVIVGPAVRKPSRKYHAWLKRKRSSFNMPYSRHLPECCGVTAVPQPQVFMLNTLFPTNQYFLTTVQPEASGVNGPVASSSFALPQDAHSPESCDFDENCAHCLYSLCTGAVGDVTEQLGPQDVGALDITRSPTTVVSPYDSADHYSPERNSTDASLTSSTGSMYSDNSDRCSCCENISAILCASQLQGFNPVANTLLMQPTLQYSQIYNPAYSAILSNALPNIQQMSPYLSNFTCCPQQPPIISCAYPTFATAATGQTYASQNIVPSNMISSFAPGTHPLICIAGNPVVQ